MQQETLVQTQYYLACGKVEKKIKKVTWIRSHHLHSKFKLWAGKFALGLFKGKTLLGVVNKLLKRFVDITQQCFALLPQVTFPPKI